MVFLGEFRRLLGGARVAGGRFRHRAAHDLFVAARGRRPASAAVPARAPVVLVFGGALGASFFVDQRLPVGDRDLIVVGMDFAEGQKAVAIAAVVDEGGLQRRLDARHLRQIDVASELFTLRGLEVEFLDAIAAQDDHPGFLRMGRVDEHFVGHWQFS